MVGCLGVGVASQAHEGREEMKTIFKLLAFAPSLLAAPAAFAGLVVSAPVDVIGNLSLSQFTTLGYGTNTYKDWGNEPFVAVNPTNINDVFISSFAYSTSSTTSGANLFYSTNARASWTPINIAASLGNADQPWIALRGS